jgi:tetratricopeptide (TPR) repeat protein
VLAVGGLVIYPQFQKQQAQQARQAEAEQHYQAGLAFQNVGDLDKAAQEYEKVIVLDANYMDAQSRLAEVKTKLAGGAATATAVAIAQAGQAQANAQATATAQAQATTQALEVHYQKGLGYMNIGRWQEAKAELEQVFVVNPNYKDVQAKLKEVETQMVKLFPTATPTPTVIPKVIKEVARGKLASASGSWQGAASNHRFPPSNVVDGITDENVDCSPGSHSYWLLPDHQTGWVQVDLQQNYKVVRLRWLNTHNGSCGDRATTRFHIMLSQTGAFQGEDQVGYSGTTAFSLSPAFQEAVLSSPVIARYVRFYVDEYYNWGGGLNEIEVYAEVPAQ